MEKRFIKFDSSDPTKVVGWRFYAEARELIGTENMARLRKAGLRIMPRENALDKLFFSSEITGSDATR
ncbi:MAG: hypothetical protein JRI85_17670 [Deltaproteobacteria bacterium]|nr:hypothetical protein [Deltaproteobacteria bacterium]